MKKEKFKLYKTKPFDGFKLGMKELEGKKVVAIPRKRIDLAKETSQVLIVQSKDSSSLDYMEFKGNEIPKAVGQFVDKWGRDGMYELYYYIWNPKKQLIMF